MRVTIARDVFIDYWTVAVPLSGQEKDDLYQSLDHDAANWDNFGHTGDIEGKASGFRMDYSGQQDWKGTMIWYVSLWGSFTATTIFTYEALQRIPSRCDLRANIGYGANMDSFRRWRNDTVSKYEGRRNMAAFNTRTRKKTGERDRGGIGIGFGSMKSAKRVTCYMASSTSVAVVEVQYRGKGAYGIGYEVLKLIEQTTPSNLPKFWDLLQELYVTNVQAVAEEFLGESLLGIHDKIQGGSLLTIDMEDDNPVDPYL